MFDTLTDDERRALSHKLVDWLCKFGEVGHVLARVALASGEIQGDLWDRRQRYLDAGHELQELRAEVLTA